MEGKNKYEKYANIKRKKIETNLEELCKGIPSEFREFMEYVRALKFDEDPNYERLFKFFENC